MDDYKRLFYMHRPDLLNSEIGSVSNRLKFKQVGNFSFLRNQEYNDTFKGPTMQTVLLVPEECLP